MPGSRAVLVFVLMLWMSASAGVQAQQIVRLGIEHYDDGDDRYEVSLLKLALEHSGEDAVLEVVSLGDTTQERVLIEFEQGRSNFDVFYSGGSPQREKRFEQIDIPLSRGLLGHRIFVTRKDQLDQLAQIKTLDEFRDYAVIGSGFGWPDTDIFRAAGFKVLPAEWKNIWRMLSVGRTNVFNLGVHEAHAERANFDEIYPNLTVDNNLLVKYRFGFFFYVRKDNRAVAELIERGLERAYEAGAFMQLFETHPRIQTALGHIRQNDLTVLEIANPYLSDRHRAIPDRYWHDVK